MKKRLSFNKFLTTILLGLTMVFFGLFVACNPGETDKYFLETDRVENVLVYQSDFDFDQYFSDSYIKKTTASGEEFSIPLTSDMLVGEIDTSSVGTKSVKFKYNSHEFNFEYVVKYKVDFFVDGEIVDTQLVLNKTELNYPENPTKEGFTFDGWEEISNEIDKNVQINAIFIEDAYAPELTTLSAVYGDMLGSLILPSNKFGAWQFEKDSNELVGNAGINTENVNFVLNGGNVIASDTVNISVSKKTVEFSLDTLEFEYDGTKKAPDFQLANADILQVNVIPFYDRNAVSVGVYDFELIVEDDNYQGGYVGQFEIVKKYVKIVVDSAQMTYGENVPVFSYNVYDVDGNNISQSLVQELNVEINPFINPDVGSYDIDIVEKSYANFDVEVQKGNLTVNKATYNVDVSVQKAVYGDVLKDVELTSSIQGIGSWQWKNQELVILTPTTFSAIVVFTPSDTKNYNSIEKEITFNVKKAINKWETEPYLDKEIWTFGQEKANVNVGKAQFGDVVVKYYQSEIELIAMPENAGEYNVVFSVEGNDNYTGLIKEIAFTIEKISVSIPTETTTTYDKEEKIFVSETNYYTVENGKGTDAKKYNVILTLKDKENYKWIDGDSQDITITFEIKQAINEWEEPSISKVKWTYGEEKAEIVQGKATFGEISVKYYEGQTEIAEMPENAGQYKAVFSVQANDNYTGLVKEIAFTIEKISVSVPQNQWAIYNGQTSTADIKDNNIYSVIENIGGIEVGEYDVKLRLIDSQNYRWETTESDQIIVKFYIQANKDNVWEIIPNVKGWIYGEQPSKPEYQSKLGNETVVIKYEGVNGTEYSSETVPTNAGQYIATFTVKETVNYSGVTATATFTIEKKAVEIPQIDSKVFTGQTLTADIIDTEYFAVIKNDGGINAGDYDVQLKVNDNYKWQEKDSEIITLTFTIEKKAVEIPQIDSKVFTGQTLTADIIDTEYFAVIKNDGGINAGDYNVQLKVNQNYKWEEKESEVITLTFTISPFGLVLGALENNKTYYENLIGLGDVIDLVKLNKDVAGEYKLTINKGQTISNGKIKVIVRFEPSSSNYTCAEIDDVLVNVYEVAYIGTNYYGSVESALSKAVSGNEVWVVAGQKQAVIAEDCTIPNGVTLNVPHTANEMNKNGKATLNGKEYAAKPTINVLTVITINERITLTNNGTLKVAGELSGGGGGSPYAGHTAGNCAKIVLKNNAKIKNESGTIDLFGLIVEESDNNGSEVIVDGGNLYVPYVVRDFRGGTYMKDVYKNATAFNEFELRNITSFVTIKNGANVYGYANLYAGEQHNETTITLVSVTQNAVIHFIDNNGYLTLKYNIVDGYQEQEEDNIKDAWLDGIMDIEIFGGATADPMSLKVKVSILSSVTVTTSNVFFPFSWRLRVSLFDGDYTMAYKYKIMPGSVFTIGNGATVTIATLAVYTQEELDTIVQPYTVTQTHYKNNTEVVDGMCVVKDGGKLIITKGVGGKIISAGGIIENNGSATVTSAEGIFSRTYTLLGKTIYEYKTQDITLSFSIEQLTN